LVFDNESWNFKRSPRLKQLKKSIALAKEGKNLLYGFKDLFRKVKIRTLEDYNRYKSIVDGGLFLTRKSIGIGIIPPVRKVRKLSFRELEFLYSKLAFWPTSFSPSLGKEVTDALDKSSVPCERISRNYAATIGLHSPTGPRKSWGVHPRSNQASWKIPRKGS
jgi:hypothetical protein